EFFTPEGAQDGLALVADLQKQNLISVQDAAVVSWPPGARKPKTRHVGDQTGTRALDGAFWGMLFGLIFFMPFLGAAVGAAAGALSGHFARYGIDSDFINDIRSKVTEGTSALFLLTSDAVRDRVIEAMKHLPKFEIIATNLPQAQEDELRAAFSA